MSYSDNKTGGAIFYNYKDKQGKWVPFSFPFDKDERRWNIFCDNLLKNEGKSPNIDDLKKFLATRVQEE